MSEVFDIENIEVATLRAFAAEEIARYQARRRVKDLTPAFTQLLDEARTSTPETSEEIAQDIVDYVLDTTASQEPLHKPVLRGLADRHRLASGEVESGEPADESPGNSGEVRNNR